MFGARALAIGTTTALIATIGAFGAASAATTGDVTVTGTTVSTLQLTLVDGSAAFGSNLDPLGTAPNSGEAAVSGTSSGVGACYEWGGTVKVDANDTYTVDVNALETHTNARLHFLAANPASYADCTGGTTFGTTDAISAVANGTQGYQNSHPFWLGLDVQWGDLHSTSAGAATIEFVIAAKP